MTFEEMKAIAADPNNIDVNSLSFEDDQDRVLGFIQLAKESGYMSFNGSKDDFILAKILCEPLGLKCQFGKKQIHIYKPE
jgi:hypothetical protein